MIILFTFLQNYHIISMIDKIIHIMIEIYQKEMIELPKINQSIETEVMDQETGEIISKRANRVLNWGDEPQYIKLYLQDILYFSDLPKHHEKILFELLKRATYAGEKYGMEITLNSSIKKRIADTLGIKNIRTINNALSDLVKGEILYRAEVGVYTLNPYLFGKGDWQDISRLRLEINYDNSIKGRTFQAYCEYKTELERQQEKQKKLNKLNQSKGEINNGCKK